MYGPYVLYKFPARKHNATILDISIDYSKRMNFPLLWWIAPTVIAVSALAGWFTTLPLN